MSPRIRLVPVRGKLSRRPGWRCLLTLLLLCCPWPALGQDANAEAERLIGVLRQGDAVARREALDRLSSMGSSALPTVRRAFEHSDPDLRFDLLFLLHEPDGRIERLVRVVIVEKVNAASYPEALDAYAKILASAKRGTASMLIRMVRRHAREGDMHDRYVGVGLCLLRDLFKAPPEGVVYSGRDATQLATLLEVDLRVGFHDLVMAFAALPSEAAFHALTAAAGGGSPLVRARAARMLGELSTQQTGAEVAAVLIPMLTDRDPRVRLAALYGLDLLPLPDKALLGVVRLVRDDDFDVALTALRLAGSRKLIVVREAAEVLAGSSNRPHALRKEALRTLGLIEAASPRLLARLADPEHNPHDIVSLAAWALGCTRAPRAREALLGLINTPGFVQEDTLYRGLARLGGDAGLDALLSLLGDPPAGVEPNRVQRALAISALGFVRGDGPRVAVELGRLAGLRPVSRLRQPGSTGPEIVGALEALANRNDRPSREELMRQLLSPKRGPQLAMTIPLVLRVGAEGIPEQLSARLSQFLADQTRLASPLRDDSAHALARIDPARARAALGSALMRLVRPDIRSRELARALARAGDPSMIASRALPYSRRLLDEVKPSERDGYLNDVGIDLLYAMRCDEALVEFQRMLWCTPRDNVAAYNMACGYALSKRAEPALRYVRRTIENGYKKHEHIASDPDLRSLHGDVRFQRLIRSLKLAEETQIPFKKYGWP